MFCCPKCGSKLLYRDGLRYLADGSSIQRWLCRNCGYRFSEPGVKLNISRKRVSETFDSGPQLFKNRVVSRQFASKESFNGLPFTFSEDVVSHELTTVGKRLNTLAYNSCKRQVCASEGEAKNLAEVETQTQAKRESTTISEFANERELFENWLKKNGHSETTVKYYVNQVTFLAKNQVNLFDPESVKEFIAKQQWSRSSKLTICYAYDAFLEMVGLTWEMPHYKPQEQPIWLPTEAEIDTLISATGKRTSIYLQLLKETGVRAGEADNLKWTGIDTERGVIYVASEKDGTPRTLKVSKQLIGRLESLRKDDSPKVFGERSANAMRSTFSRQRKTIAHKLYNPRLLQIHFHTIRHWYATMLYHLTKNPRLVQKRLGHRNLKTTERYIHLEEDVYGNEGNEHFICEIVKTAEEAKKLIEHGYDFVNEIDGEFLYRKRE